MTANRRRVLVTGATGFLGGNVLTALGARPDVEAVAACRTPDRLPGSFAGEVRVGDLRDPGYRRAVVDGVDSVCHTGTWSALWGHAELERTRFFEPTIDLIEQAIRAGVGRFIQASTVVIASPQPAGAPVDDHTPARRSGFWPHLDYLVELDEHMRANRHRGTQMVTLRLGHFLGAGNGVGLVPALVPRLRTRLVPWLDHGRARLPLVADTDLGQAFTLASTADGLADYESFNICGASFPTAREVIEFIAAETDSPRPRFSVPYTAGHAFGALMEWLHPVLPGASPFLTRSIVHVARDWWCPIDRATEVLGYRPRKPWRTALRESLADRSSSWPRLDQDV